MSLFGYARVSTTEQDLIIQVAALRAAGCQTIRSEKKSGNERGARTELQILMDFLREGDTLVVTRIDRLARSMKDLQDIVHELKGRGVALKATEQPIDTGTAAGKAFLDMLGVFAEFETNLRRERQAEGIAAAKARGVYKGGKARIDPEAIRGLATAGVKPAHIAQQLGISRGTVYRFLPAANDPLARRRTINGSVGNTGSTDNTDIAGNEINDINTDSSAELSGTLIYKPPTLSEPPPITPAGERLSD